MTWLSRLFQGETPDAPQPQALSDHQALILSYAREYGRVFWTPRNEGASPPGTFRTPGERRAIKALVDKGYLQAETCGWSITEAGRGRIG